jgi:hypothetical protein
VGQTNRPNSQQTCNGHHLLAIEEKNLNAAFHLAFFVAFHLAFFVAFHTNDHNNGGAN